MVYVDRNTLEVQAQPSLTTVALKMSARTLNALDTSAESLKSSIRGDISSIDLDGRFQPVWIAIRDPQGQIRTSCLTSLPPTIRDAAGTILREWRQTARATSRETSRPVDSPLRVFAVGRGAVINVVSADPPGVGFNDPTPAPPVGGNPGTTIGQQRLFAFRYAANLWAARLTSGITINVRATFGALDCDSDSGVLGHAGPTSYWTPGPITVAGTPSITVPGNTWVAVALAEKLLGQNLNDDNPEISAEFNGDIGRSNCLPFSAWYLGVDGNPPFGDMDFVSVLLHELGHGLGFLTTINMATGEKFLGKDSMYDYYLYDISPPNLWRSMENFQRARSATVPNNVVWLGPATTAAIAAGALTAGKDGSNRAMLYTPATLNGGSSVSHWNQSWQCGECIDMQPHELMKPLYTTPVHHTVITQTALQDLGWGSVDQRAVHLVSFAALPGSGTSPLDPALTATVTGGRGTINYTFWWDCTASVSNVQEGISRCGDPADPAKGGKYDGRSEEIFTVHPPAYTATGIHRAIVVAEREDAADVAAVEISVLPTGMSLSLQATPAAGAAPLDTILTASVAGLAGSLDYWFWWDCSIAGTDLPSITAQCGTPPSPIPGQCLSNTAGYTCHGISARQVTTSTHTYAGNGTYTPKAVIESAGLRIAQQTSVSAGPGTPGEVPVPLTPGYSVPTQYVNSRMPILTWTPVAGVEAYSIRILRYPFGLENLVYSSDSIPASAAEWQLSPDVLVQDQYRWSIRARYGSGWSAFSPPLYFNVNDCWYLVSPTQITIAPDSGMWQPVAVNTSYGCPGFDISTQTSWLWMDAARTVKSGSCGGCRGGFTTSFWYDANPSGSRSGTVYVSGNPITVVQGGAGCGGYALSHRNASFLPAGGTGTVNVTAGAGCDWAVYSSSGWVTIASGLRGSGAAQLTYVVAPNTTASPRTANLIIAGVTFQVHQSAAPCQTVLSVSNPDVTGADFEVPFHQNFTQSGAFGAPAFAITDGAPPWNLSLSTDGTLSGTPHQSGTFALSVAVTDANGCRAAGPLYELYICPPPEITASRTDICDGAVAVLTSNRPSGNQWFRDGTAIPGATGMAYSATAAGVYTVRTTRSGCTTATSPPVRIIVGCVPTISSVLPVSGPPAGGTSVTIRGSFFRAGATVKFGDVPAPNVVRVDASTITATAPVHVEGVVDVRVTNADTGSGAKESAFTFSAPSGTRYPKFSYAAVGSAAQTGYRSIVSRDFNGDGHEDLVVTRDFVETIYTGRGDGTFDPPQTFTFGSGAWGQVAGDFNGDGFTDFALDSNGWPGIFYGDATAPLQNHSWYECVGTPLTQTLAAADLDHDGRLDLVVPELLQAQVMIGCDPAHVYSVNERPAGVVAADFDGDGHQDLILTSDTTGAAAFLHGNGDGSFTRGADIPTGTGSLGGIAIAAGDFDADGILDLALSNRAILLGTGDGTFDAALPVPSAEGRHVAVADFNNDGLLDVAIDSSRASVAINIGDGTGHFTAGPVVPYSTAAVDTFTTGDFDSNGTVDLAMGSDPPVVALNRVMVCAELEVGPASLPAGQLGTGYLATFVAGLAEGAVVFSAAGQLPPGLTLSGATLSGTPTAAGSFSFTITATDANGCRGSKAYMLSVADFASPPQNLIATAAGTQSVALSWTPVTGADHYEVGRSSNGTYSLIGSPSAPAFTDAGVVAGAAYAYKVRAVAASGATSPFSTPDIATAVVFADEPLVARSTLLRAIHVTQLRTAVNAVRAAAGLAPWSYTDVGLTGIPVKAVHINELRTALDGARAQLGMPALAYAETLQAGSTIKAGHVAELRDGTK